MSCKCETISLNSCGSSSFSFHTPARLIVPFSNKFRTFASVGHLSLHIRPSDLVGIFLFPLSSSCYRVFPLNICTSASVGDLFLHTRTSASVDDLFLHIRPSASGGVGLLPLSSSGSRPFSLDFRTSASVVILFCQTLALLLQSESFILISRTSASVGALFL